MSFGLLAGESNLTLCFFYFVMRTLCFATGNIWRIMEKIDLLDFISNLDIDGVEYTYGRFYDERKPNQVDFDFFKKYKYVSMHAPFRLSLDKMEKESFDSILNQIESDYKKMNAKHIVFHPGIVLPKEMPKLDYITENLNPKKGKNRSRDGFEKILNKNNAWDLCLDASHAYDWGIEETERIVKKWKHRIKQVHFSNNRYHKDHKPFEKVSKGFLKSIEPLKELNVPFIIEEDMHYKKINDVKKEIKRVRDILSL